MQIDEAIEDHVRSAFSAAIGHDPKDLKSALARIKADDFPIAVSYAVYACGYIVADVFNGELQETAILEMAEYVINDNNDWIDLGDTATVASFLQAAANGNINFPGVPTEDVAGNSFVIGGYLLSRFRPEGQRWFEYLDTIWNSTA